MKKIILSIILCLCCCASSFGVMTKFDDIREGDIVFQISKSKQAPFIMYAQRDLYSHCGIVIEKNKQLYVLEASNVVKLTPYSDWVNKGRFTLFTEVRVFDKPIKIKYKKYLGQPYDMSFKFNNGKMYCSELVYVIYKEQFGIELCKPRKVSTYRTFGLGWLLRKRGINPNQLVVAPVDLEKSKYVHNT